MPVNDDAEENIDITRLTYGLYIRKSTDDKERQQRSLEDQIAECEDLAAKLGIKIKKPYYEDKGSAKLPSNPKRSRFYDMLSDLRSGKIEGVIAWHPDRLARNMQDGGAIFGLIDDKRIKDLKFVTHYFTNDATGKMLLGIQFTLSTYYSANLAQNVKRGHRNNFKEGKSSGAPKHGYIRTQEGVYAPDGINYELIVEAWQMRKRATSLKEIADYMNDHGYGRIIKDTKAKRHGQKVKMTHQILNKLFKDSFYYGVLVQVNKSVDLRDAYGFEPAVSEEDFNEVQRLSRGYKLPLVVNRRKSFLPLRHMVKCSFCDHYMIPAPSTGNLKTRYLYFRCTNADCKRKKKSLRFHVVFNFIYDLLEGGLQLTNKDYQVYRNKLVTAADTKRLKIRTEINSREGALKATKRRIKEISTNIISYDKNSSVWKVNNEQLSKLEKDEANLLQQLNDLRELLGNPEQDLLSINQFLNLAKNARSHLMAADEVAKDHICRLLFLNLVVDEEKVVSYHLKEPFKTALKVGFFSNGRGDRI